MNRFHNQDPISRRGANSTIDIGLRNYMTSIFGHMSVGLLITAIVAYAVSLSPQIFKVIYGTPLFFLVLLAPFGMVVYLSSRWMTLKYETAQAFFLIYAVLNGIMLSSIFFQYSPYSIGQAFLTTSGMFGAMSLWGYTTNRDLTGMGSFLSMGLIGLIIAMVVNLFLRSTAFDLTISWIGVFIFTGLTAFDTQKLKQAYYQLSDHDMKKKLSIIGALVLYLDFINIFLFLLRLMGNRNSSS